MTPTVLYFDPAGMASAAKWVFAQQGIRIRTVSTSETGCTVSSLADGTAAPAEDAPACLDTPVLIFCGLAEAQLDAILLGLRRARVPRTVFKAVLTPHNAGWRFADLCAELARERAAYAARPRS